MDIAAYVAELTRIHTTGTATEHSYRPAIARLFNDIAPEVRAQNEPKRTPLVGAPDFVFTRTLRGGDVAIGHVEAKDLGHDLKKLKGREKEQFDAYASAFANLLYTDGLTFLFYRGGKLRHEVQIGEFLLGWRAYPDRFDTLKALLVDFAAQTPITVTSPEVLARLMAGKAILVRRELHEALIEDGAKDTSLTQQYEAFKEQMIHDMSVGDFAGMYAETVAYGMFAARLHDTTLETFSRHEAMDLLPKSNPFLRKFFGYIAGPELDERVRWAFDDLTAIFLATDVAKLMEGFGKLTGRSDPFLHFYETFLAAYDPKKRKARGVWYTPQPVVNFIVRAVDEVLRTEFGLPDGLADTSKVRVEVETGQRERTKKGDFRKDGRQSTVVKDVHRVQILDPATGTGTFLAEVIRQIAPRIKGVAPGMWNTYVEQELIPRLHGFELLMASYAMCHLKLDMMLAEMGYTPTGTPPRLGVYLTNSLEEGEVENMTLPFARWLSDEVREANRVKRDTPIMCVIGNPPYLGEAGKPQGWIGKLMEDYKKEPGGKVKLKERNPKWLNDLYVQFIRMSSHLIERNGEGVLGFVTNHGYLNNPTFRGMRWHLLKTFDRIWVLDLHGNAKKKEVAPDGSPDKNVFDIQQGVAIIVAVKRNNTADGLAELRHGELWGTRALKGTWLTSELLTEAAFSTIDTPPYEHAFVPRDWKSGRLYNSGFSVRDLFPIGGTGIVTKRDDLTIHETRDGVWRAVQDMLTETEQVVRQKYKLPADVRDWRYAWAVADLRNHLDRDNIQPVAYRPFDNRFIYFTGNARGFVGWPVPRIMSHFQRGANIGLATARSNKNPFPDHFFITDRAMETKYSESSTQSAVFPLYVYPAASELDQAVRPNFEPNLHREILSIATDASHGAPTPEDIFDYIYAVLHCPAYRKTYAEFLRIDFPRIPWPKDAAAFWDLVPHGTALRRLHLMEPAAIGETPYPFTGEGDGVVDRPRHEDGHVWINATQRFENVPETAWTFPIGGYLPAQKWLKDRKGRALSFDDVRHYARVVKILLETDRIMKGIVMDLT